MNFPTTFFLILIIVWVLHGFLLIIFDGFRLGKILYSFFCSACYVICFIGFFGARLSALGGLDGLPKTFEWPIGTANEVLVLSDGTNVVPHIPSSRIQIYNKKLEFQKSWVIEAEGGDFKLYATEDGTFHIYVIETKKRYEYNTSSKLIATAKFQPIEMNELEYESKKVRIPTPIIFLVFGNAFASLAVGVLGIILMSFRSKIFKDD